MPLNVQEKLALRDQIELLLEADEPEAILATLQRMAERKAHGVTRGKISELEALRWQALADACAAVEKELELANAPRSHLEAQPVAPGAPNPPHETPDAA